MLSFNSAVQYLIYATGKKIPFEKQNQKCKFSKRSGKLLISA